MSALRTSRRGDLLLRGRDWFIVGIAGLILPPFLGIAIGTAGYLLPSTLGSFFGGFGGMLMISPLLTILLIPLGLMIGGFALRHGWAGWVIAVTVPTALTLAVVGTFIPGSGYSWQSYAPQLAIFGGAAAIHAAVMWLTLRWRCPEALAAR
jgi:hypothetical protein